MTDIKIMFLISLACLTFSEWSGVVQLFNWWLMSKGIRFATISEPVKDPIKGIKFYQRRIEKRLKPFDCAMCLTLWASLAIFIYMDYKWWAVLYAFANSGLTIIIDNANNRIRNK